MLEINGEIVSAKELTQNSKRFETLPSRWKDMQFKLNDNMSKEKYIIMNGYKQVVQSFASSYNIEAYYSITNPKSKERLNVRYYDTKNKVKGEDVYEPMFIKFSSGFMTVPKDNRELQWFMMCHPQNIDNPIYATTELTVREPLFELVDVTKGVEKQYATELAIHKANTMLYGHPDERLSKAHMDLVYKAYGGTDLEELKHAKEAGRMKIKTVLFEKVKSDPHGFLKKVNDTRLDLVVQIDEALRIGVLTYNKKENKYSWGPKAEVDGKVRKIYEVEGDGDPTIEFINYLREQDTKSLDKFVAEMEKARNATSKKEEFEQDLAL